MKLLAIETSSNACSVALGVDGDIRDEHVVEPRAHTTILMPMISRLMDAAGIGAADLDAVVLGNGPGSFIGMRIGASVAQGLCYAAGLQILPVSSLAAVAAEALRASDAGRVVVTQDARMHEVYVGEYRRGKHDLPEAECAEYIAPAGKLDLPGERYLAAGGGWRRFPELAQVNKAQILSVSVVVEPRACYLLSLAAAAPDAAIPPAELVPAYLRQKVADAPPRKR